jgi:diguanylate cyclase (GGDEF)-like protein/PAS domain S-box-containing protein
MTATVLIIDDNEDDQRLYQRALKNCDCTLVMAATAEAGLARIAEIKPDLILLDYNLPDADGLSVMQWLAERGAADIPVVMLTGESITAVAVEAMKQGADDYLVKDTEGLYLRLLPDVIRRVLAVHEQQRQTRSLRQETERLLRRNQLLMQNSMDSIYIMDIQGNVLDANHAFCEMLGYTPEEATRLNIADWDAQWPKEELQERFIKQIGKKTRFETVHRRKDGSQIHVEVSASGVKIDGQHLMFASSRDITLRKQGEAALLRYRQVIEAAIDGFWLTDMQGHVLAANAAYASMSGYTVEELAGMPISQLDALDGPEDVAARAARLMANGHERFETVHRHKDGHLMNVEVSITYLSEIQQCFVFCHDITERKRAEEVIAKNEVNMRAMLDNSPYLTWLKDTEGRYIKINKVFADFLRLDDVRQAEGKTDLDMQPKELAEKYRADDAEVMAKREQKRVEEVAFDGKNTSWVEAYKTPIIDADGKVLGTVGFAKDITLRKKAEDELRIAAVAFETHDAIVITDARANIVRVNQAFTDVTGYTQDEVLGKNPRIMSSGRQDKTFYIEMWQQLLHTGSWAGEIWDKRKNGQIYPKWLTITAVRNECRETTHYVAIFSDITARKQAEEEIRNLAFYDALTRLPNRRLFLDRFRAALTTSARRNDYGAVLFIDMDRFKILNDTLGHDFGDMLLVEVACRIKSCVREMDTVARLGGDEFVVLIEGVSHDGDEAPRHVGIVAEKIREALAQPYRLKTHEHHSSPSIGISMYSGHKATVDEVLQQADMAMYQAKNAGRNAVRFFDPVMQQNVATRAELENDLHHALAFNQLRLHYQVQVDGVHRPTGAEALLRWFHPQRGVIMPGQFIQIAEESTLILDIGGWVLDEACRQLALWAKNERTNHLTLAVNVSAKQFAQPNFVDQVARCMAAHGVAPSLLKLELTEGLVLEDMHGAIGKMHELKKLGVRLSIDDFGTGYSSLSYLKLLPLDQIKIDQSFIHGITGDGNDALLVQTIIDLAVNFRMNVIAEGVETHAQLDFLKRNDCTAYQGFLFSKPVPIEEFEELLGEA